MILGDVSGGTTVCLYSRCFRYSQLYPTPAADATCRVHGCNDKAHGNRIVKVILPEGYGRWSKLNVHGLCTLHRKRQQRRAADVVGKKHSSPRATLRNSYPFEVLWTQAEMKEDSGRVCAVSIDAGAMSFVHLDVRDPSLRSAARCCSQRQHNNAWRLVSAAVAGVPLVCRIGPET